MLYIGYYGKHMLCVSKYKKEVKWYLKNIRKLDKKSYTIDERMGLDMSIADDFYYKYVIDEWNGLLLPRRDIIKIDEEIHDGLRRITYTEELMTDLYDTISFNKSLTNTKESLMEAIRAVRKICSSNKKREKFEQSVALRSLVFSTDIEEYLSLYRSEREQREMNRRFHYQLEKDE